jgi:hypothetical protein
MVYSLKGVARSAVSEFSGAELGDPRRTRRLLSIVRRIEQSPSATFPRAMSSTSELEALYRFTTNMKFSADSILKPHFSASIDRARAHEEVLVLHDSSDVLYGGETRREGLGRASAANNQGFLLHASLLCSADGLRTPFGVGALETISRAGKPFRPKKRRRTEIHDPNRESLRWGRAVEIVESRLQRPRSAIHVMDAAGDMFDLLQQLIESDIRFVIRASYPNRVVKDTEGLRTNLRGLLAQAKPKRERRRVRIARRGGKRPAQTQRRHPARASRVATLAFSSAEFALLKSEHSNRKATGATLNVVRVFEPSPPEGEEPVEWMLLTTEPLDTMPRILRVVDHYRARWLVEEYFKSLKTGCSLEKRQSGSYQALVKVTALLVPVAYRLLLLRSLERQNPQSSAAVFFDAVDVQLMRMDDSTPGLPEIDSLAAALQYLARMGGHLKHNGPPGWITLGRGFEKLLSLRRGWDAAQTLRLERQYVINS